VPGMTGTIGRAPRLTGLARIALAGALVVPGLIVLAQAAHASGLAGPRWRAQSPPVPAGAIASDLAAVSCASRRACVAVGNFESSGSTFTAFAEIWNGRAWAIRGTPGPTASNLSGVSCTSARACTAVGDSLSQGALVTLAERWNGTRWRVQRTPSPRSAARSFLVSVSCSSRRACTATGFYISQAGTQRTLAEHWNGTRWVIQPTPSPAGKKTSQLNAVSCTSATACNAVGSFTSGTFAEAWNGRKWKIHRTPTPRGGRNGFLRGISCTSAKACTAVGDYFNGSRTVPLAEHWNGSRWHPQHAATATGATSSGLTSVSCVRAGACFAVAFFRQANTDKTLAEHWNGQRWIVQGTQMPPDARSADLTSVSCPSPVTCTATGFFTSISQQTQTILAERYS
jgi:hypothetical protein